MTGLETPQLRNASLAAGHVSSCPKHHPRQRDPREGLVVQRGAPPLRALGLDSRGRRSQLLRSPCSGPWGVSDPSARLRVTRAGSYCSSGRERHRKTCSSPHSVATPVTPEPRTQPGSAPTSGPRNSTRPSSRTSWTTRPTAVTLTATATPARTCFFTGSGSSVRCSATRPARRAELEALLGSIPKLFDPYVVPASSITWRPDAEPDAAPGDTDEVVLARDKRLCFDMLLAHFLRRITAEGAVLDSMQPCRRLRVEIAAGEVLGPADNASASGKGLSSCISSSDEVAASGIVRDLVIGLYKLIDDELVGIYLVTLRRFGPAPLPGGWGDREGS